LNVAGYVPENSYSELKNAKRSLYFPYELTETEQRLAVEDSACHQRKKKKHQRSFEIGHRSSNVWSPKLVTVKAEWWCSEETFN
jgi:hypothetical protein